MLQNQNFCLTLVWRYNKRFLSERAFCNKILVGPLFFICPFDEQCSNLGAVLWQLPSRLFLADFTTLFHSWVPNYQGMSKIGRKYACTITVIAQPPVLLHRSSRWHIKDNEQINVFSEHAPSYKILCCSAKWGWN